MIKILRTCSLSQRIGYGFMNPDNFDYKKDYYKVLNISPTEDQEQIKEAYYKLAKQYHPDMHKGKEDQFKAVKEAYEILSDQKRKKEYDSYYAYKNTNKNTQHGDYYEQHFSQKQGRAFYEQYKHQFRDFERYQEQKRTNQKIDPEFEKFEAFMNTFEKVANYYVKKQQQEAENQKVYMQNQEKYNQKEAKLAETVSHWKNKIKGLFR